MKKNRYFLYARKSSEDEEHQILSIEAQLTEVREYAKKESVEVAKEFLENKSAKVPGRPVFNAMIEEIEKGAADGLIAWHPDRLARNSIDGGRIIYLLDTGKLKALKFPTFWFDNTPQGKFMLNIAFGQSKYYVDNLSENVLRGLRQKVRRGEWPGKAPVGYLNEPKLRTIIVDPARAECVIRLFEAYASGKYSLPEIHERALLWGLTTNAHNMPVSRHTVRAFLANSFYAGSFVFLGEMHEGAHKPLISWELFDRVQAVIRSAVRGFGPRHLFPFIRFMRCGECGAAVTAQRAKGHTYYRCTHQKGPCTQKHYLREEALAEQLRPTVEKVVLPADWFETMFSLLADARRAEDETVSMAIKQAQDQLVALQMKLDRLMDLFLEGAVSRDEFNEYKQKWIPQKQEIKTRIVSFQNRRNPPLDTLDEFLNTARGAAAVAKTDNLADIRIFHQKIGSKVQIMPGRIVQVEYSKLWHILAERSLTATWLEVFEALRAEVGLLPQ